MGGIALSPFHLLECDSPGGDRDRILDADRVVISNPNLSPTPNPLTLTLTLTLTQTPKQHLTLTLTPTLNHKPNP